MSSSKQVELDNEIVTSSTEKTDEPDEEKSESSNSENEDTDSNASSEYEVEKILAKRRRRRGGYEYYIKWVGYGESANEWIPESSLNCPERLAEFRREEARKRKRSRRERERSFFQKRRSKNHNRSKKRRVKVIEDDDDDDDADRDHEQEVTKSVGTSNSTTTDSVKTKETKSMTYGVEKGYQVQAILGINRTKGDQLHYLVHYKAPTMFDDNMELIPASIAKKYCEDELIQFYETRITWNDHQIE